MRTQPMIAVSGVRNSWLIVARNSSFMRLATSACLRALRVSSSASAVRRSRIFFSVISRVMLEAPMIAPPPSRIGDIVKETSITAPSFRRRVVSKWSMRSPRRIWLTISCSSSANSGGMIRMIDWPIISSAVYPKIRAAAGFQLVTILFKSLETIASSAFSTMAARYCSASGDGSVCFDIEARTILS